MSAVEQASPQFSNERLEEIKALIARYPHPRSALLPVLHMAQEDFGYLSMDVQTMVAKTLDLHLMAVREVVTFYTMFREKPCGTYLLEVCTNATGVTWATQLTGIFARKVRLCRIRVSVVRFDTKGLRCGPLQGNLCTAALALAVHILGC